MVLVELGKETAGALQVGLEPDPGCLDQLGEPVLEQLCAGGDQLGAGFGELELPTIACAGGLRETSSQPALAKTPTMRLVEGSDCPSHRDSARWFSAP